MNRNHREIIGGLMVAAGLVCAFLVLQLLLTGVPSDVDIYTPWLAILLTVGGVALMRQGRKVDVR